MSKHVFPNVSDKHQIHTERLSWDRYARRLISKHLHFIHNWRASKVAHKIIIATMLCPADQKLSKEGPFNNPRTTEPIENQIAGPSTCKLWDIYYSAFSPPRFFFLIPTRHLQHFVSIPFRCRSPGSTLGGGLSVIAAHTCPFLPLFVSFSLYV